MKLSSKVKLTCLRSQVYQVAVLCDFLPMPHVLPKFDTCYSWSLDMSLPFTFSLNYNSTYVRISHYVVNVFCPLFHSSFCSLYDIHWFISSKPVSSPLLLFSPFAVIYAQYIFKYFLLYTLVLEVQLLSFLV